MRSPSHVWAAVSCVALIATLPVSASVDLNDFGVHGILDIPSAEMAPEGNFAATLSRKDAADIYAIGFQVFPRIEVSFRYTIFNAREFSPRPGVKCFANADFCDGLRDRSFEIRYQMLRESEFLPAVTVGVRDFLGTGAWSAEYLVGSKTLGNLDLTAGLGWGRLAGRPIMTNPLTKISDVFADRVGFAGVGGEVALGSFFRGPNVGLFGGMRYRIPQWNLSVVAAYNSDDYGRERQFGTIPDADPLSYGLEWEASPGFSLGVSWQQGNQLALRLNASLDAAATPPKRRPNSFGAPGPVAPPRNDIPADTGWWPRIVNDAEASGLLLRAAQKSPDGQSLNLQYSNMAHQLEADAISRVISLTNLYAPPEVKDITATGDYLGLTTHSVQYRRPAPEALEAQRAANDLQIMPAQDLDQPNFLTRYRYPNGKTELSLGLRNYLFDPEFPFLYQVYLRARTDVDLGGGWSATGSWVQNINSQFGRIVRGSNSQLPTVRSLARNYLQEGETGIDDLVLMKRGKLAPDLYYQAYAGILEEMFSGVGGEVLWRPFGSRVALGANVIAVQQRDFDKMFGLQDYRIVTGHLSMYWASPFNDLDVIVHAGRYLAGDVGATLEVQKRFANGWSVGAFATLTNVPFEVFGEGSFDKGLIFRIPFDLYSPRNVRGYYRTQIRSVNRDGGRLVDNWPGNLWERLRDTHTDRLLDFKGRMTPE